ncbi:SDR family NAD(P)-dependent oxidoreductase [soil metagenome]
MISTSGPVLVTGAAGFIGSAVAARLAGMGLDVVGCDNFNDYYSPKLKHDRVRAILGPAKIECESTEIAASGIIDKLFERYRPSLVVHLAAQAGVRYSLQNPSAYIQSNLVGFSNILNACEKHQVQHLLYASSSSVYGANTEVPFREYDKTDEPVSLYAATKKANEVMAHSFAHLYGLPATGLRFFTAYGPWGRPDMAYFSFTRKMLNCESIPVFAEGKLLRDFTYIDDIVEGVVRLLFKPTASENGAAPHAIFNIGNHQPVRIMDFINTLERVLNVTAKIEFLPMQPGDVTATYADTTKLREWVDFAPSTVLENGLVKFRDWYKEWSKV